MTAREYASYGTIEQWRRIIALNGLSALAQVGQYGITFVLFPLALEARRCPPWQIGVVSSALWAGLLIGLLGAPRTIRRFGFGRTIAGGLIVSAAALIAAPGMPSQWWTISAIGSGVGWGLRWIANETWLFSSAPAQAQGRIVGFHESLLAVAAIVGPAVIAFLDVRTSSAFFAAAAFTLSAAVPLWAAGASATPEATPASRQPGMPGILSELSRFITLGSVIAGIGGLLEGGTISLLPVFASLHGFSTEQTAWVLSVYGAGALLLQFPIGWLTDARGTKYSANLAALTTAMCALALIMVPLNTLRFSALMFVLGGSLTGFLTLGIIAATRDADPDFLSDEFSRVSIAFSAFSIIGPLICSALASMLGGDAVMGFTCAASILLLIVVNKMRRPTNQSGSAT